MQTNIKGRSYLAVAYATTSSYSTSPFGNTLDYLLVITIYLYHGLLFQEK